MPEARYLLFTDADIVHDRYNLHRLVWKAESKRLRLVSLMVKLRAESFWERLLIPAFVFFFQMLYPFPRINDANAHTAAAAGGCMLVCADALDAAGGIVAVRNRVIDDCALARILKAQGPIWLGLSEDTHSLRTYRSLAPIWQMVTRTAFIQLRHSWILLGFTIAGMSLLYFVPPLAFLGGIVLGRPLPALLGAFGWWLMVRAYTPTLKLYGQHPMRALWLPVVALLYTLMTLHSSILHELGKGALWKGRGYSRTDGRTKL